MGQGSEFGGGVKFTQRAPASASAREQWWVTFVVTNTAADVRTVELTGSSDPTFDILLRRTTGDTIWRRLADVNVGLTKVTLTLPPQTERTFMVEVPSSVAGSGRFCVSGSALGTGGTPISAGTSSIDILP